MGIKHFVLSVCVSAALLASLAAYAGITPDERQQVQVLEKQYQSCLGGQLRLLIDGSDDIALIVRASMGQCSGHLQAIRDKLLSFGVSDSFADGWLEQLQEETKNGFTAFALQKKAERKKELLRGPTVSQ